MIAIQYDKDSQAVYVSWGVFIIHTSLCWSEYYGDKSRVVFLCGFNMDS